MKASVWNVPEPTTVSSAIWFHCATVFPGGSAAAALRGGVPADAATASATTRRTRVGLRMLIAVDLTIPPSPSSLAPLQMRSACSSSTSLCQLSRRRDKRRYRCNSRNSCAQDDSDLPVGRRARVWCVRAERPRVDRAFEVVSKRRTVLVDACERGANRPRDADARSLGG